MTRLQFMDLLADASTRAVAFARRYVDNALSSTLRYRVLLNQSFDGHATADERVYPEDDGREHGSLSPEAVVDLLCREGRCPEWIDIAVEAEADDHTRLRLLCCGRYTDDLKRMYYARQGTGPFGIKSPILPVGYVEGTRFRLPKV